MNFASQRTSGIVKPINPKKNYSKYCLKFYDEGNELRGVYVNGDFNDWCGECDNATMEKNSDGIYIKTVQMPSGDNKFIFSINGWDGAKRDKENDYEEWIAPGKEGLDCSIAPELKEYNCLLYTSPSPRD